MGGPASPKLKSLLAAIPDDPLTAFVLADYLEEQGDPPRQLQGELLRLVYTLTRSAGGEGRAQQERRLQALLRQGVRAVGPYRSAELGKKVTMGLAWVPPGVFLMGSSEDESGRGPDEGPRHEVTLTRGFWMGTAPVTQEQYHRLQTGNFFSNPYRGGPYPVNEVEWDEAVAFCDRLSERDGEKAAGLVYRLPTEAEWEYSCRAGTTTRFWSGDGEADLERVDWYRANSDGVQPVGKAANGWGLSDLHGNVCEWCADWYDSRFYARRRKTNPVCRNARSQSRVKRGGHAYQDAVNCRSASRDEHTPDTCHNDLGFRVVADRREADAGAE